MNLLKQINIQFRRFRLARRHAAYARMWRVSDWSRTDTLTIARQRQNGFTMIELMIAIAIVGILTAGAAYAYSGYSTRAAGTEAVRLADGTETAVTEAIQSAGVAPGSDTTAGVDATQAGKYVAGLHVYSGGVISAGFATNAPAGLAGTQLDFAPFYTVDASGAPSSSIAFLCGYMIATPPTGWTAVPADAEAANAAPTTTTPAQFLPKSCRPGG